MQGSRIFVFGLAGLVLAVATAAAQPPGRFGGRGRGQPSLEQQAFDRLRLTGTQETKAQNALDSHTRATRRMLDNARLELIKGMEKHLTAPQMLEFKDGLNTGRGRGRTITADDMVERVMACDRNKTGKVAKEDLPERMQHLVALGDTNKDGYLDRDEAKQLALKLSQQPRQGPGRNAGPPFNPADAERSLERLQLSAEQKDKAKFVLEGYRQKSRKVTDERREDLVKTMKEVLTEDQVKQFKDSLQAGPRRFGGTR